MKTKKIKRLKKPSINKLKSNDLPTPTDVKDGIGSTVERKKLYRLGFWGRRKIRKKPENSFLIKMIFSNGTTRVFVIATNEETFKYKKRTYNLRYEDVLFNLTDNQFELTYHEDFVNPIDRKIVKLGDKAYFSTTPENIKSIIDMEYVKALSSSIELNKFFKSSLILALINLFAMLFIIFSLLKLNKIVGALVGLG